MWWWKQKVITDPSRIERLLSRDVHDVIQREHLRKALEGGRRLRVKLGIDPTGKNIHIGRAIVLWKLREFQDLGHKVVLIIGDYTALIGDPSDKLEKRPMLTASQIRENLKGYLAQIGTIVNLRKAEIRYNSEWLRKLRLADLLDLQELFTASQMIERRNFKDRWEREQEISLREFSYPLMQGYDSFAVKADVELGGTDQLFNLLAGRKIQEHYGQKPQDILLTEMLEGTDGRKMSTSWGNVINISDAPDEQYGKAMSIHDDLIVEYSELAAGMERADMKRLKGTDRKKAKQDLAFGIVKRYHGEKAARAAAEKWEQLFSKKEVESADIPELNVQKTVSVLDLVMASGVAKSKSEARRLVEQGAVSVNGVPVKNWSDDLALSGGDTVKIGSRHFFRIKLKR